MPEHRQQKGKFYSYLKVAALTDITVHRSRKNHTKKGQCFCMKNTLKLIKKLGLVGATGQLGHFLASKVVAEGGRGSGPLPISKKM